MKNQQTSFSKKIKVKYAWIGTEETHAQGTQDTFISNIVLLKIVMKKRDPKLSTVQHM